MRTLRFVEIAEDGQTLILAPDVPQAIDNGERYGLAIDERLRAASRGDVSRLGQIEIDLGVDLPPREIQTRIRAGESAEQVAAASGMRLERIERYAYPVLQERVRMVDQAGKARVRLRDSQPSAPLLEFAAERLAVMGADQSDTRWDACRAGGNWEIRLAWRAGHRSGTARWEYDPATRSVTPLDSATSEFAEGSRLVRLVNDEPSPDQGQLDEHATIPLSVPPIGRRGENRGYRGAPVDVLLGGGGGGGGTARPAVSASVSARSDDPEGDARAHDPRARIPSWEDIVFGVRRRG